MPSTIFQSQALIETPAADVDTSAGAWEVADDLGLTARGFNLTAGQIGQLQAGAHVTIAAGYDADRVTLIKGRVHSVDENVAPGAVTYAVNGQDIGISEILGSPITFVWEAQPPFVLPRAHAIIREAGAQVGVAVGSLGFPDYPLYASYVVHQRNLLEIVQELLEPWNLFAPIQHYPIVRDDLLSVIRVDWSNPPSTGYAAVRARQGSRRRQQRLYDDPPRLATVIELEVRGAAYTQQKPNLGVERRYQYNLQRRVNREILESFAGTYEDFVWLEIYTLEEREEGKVIHTEESHYQTTLDANGVPGDADLVRRVTVDYEYYVPAQAIAALVAFEPISKRNALLWATAEVHEGVDETTSVFGPLNRTLKQYYYDDLQQQYAEQETAQEFDAASGLWKPARVTVRTHSQTSSSTVRTQLTSYTVDPDDDNRLAFDVLDSQQVGGRLTTTNSQAGRDDVMSVQARFPALDLINGVPTERRRSSNAWSYENPYLGQAEVERLYNLAVAERAFQLTPVRWETVDFDGTLDPNIWAGQPLHVEIAAGVFVDYWCESVRHRYDINSARSSGTARRLTESILVDPTIVTVAAPTNLVATPISTTEIDLTWTDNAANESSYRVEQSLNQVTWVEIAILPANSTAYSVSGLTPATLYYFRVRCFALV